MNHTQTQRYVSRFEPLVYVSTFTQKDFTISSTQDFSHRESPVRIWVNTIRSTQLLSPTNATSTQEARHNNNHLYT